MKLPALLATLLLATAVSLPAKPGQQFPPLTPQETSAIEAALPEVARAEPQKPRKILVFYRTEGFVHNSIPNASYALEQMGKRTGAFTIVASDDMAMFDPGTLNTFDAVLFNNTTKLAFENPAHRKALLDFAASGKGIIGIHAASDNFYNWPEGQALMGGVFHSHPWFYKDTVAVKNDDPGHILNTAFNKRGFWVTEEIYQIVGPYSRDTHRVLLSLDMSRPENARPANKIARADNDFPISWLKSDGAVRVFYTSLGHNKNIFEVPQILQHILDGIQYALGDLEADAIPSAKLKTPPAPAFAPDDKTPIQKLTPLPTLAALSAYEFGDPLAPRLAYEKYLRTATPEQSADAETELIELIASPKTTAAAKNIFLRWLGWIGTEQSVATLTAAAQNPTLAHAAISALATINTSQATSALASLIKNNDNEAALIEAINALGQQRSGNTVADIAKLVDDKNPAVVSAALEALANIASPNAIAALRALPLTGDNEIPHTRALIAATANLLRRDPTSKNRTLAIDVYSKTLRAATTLTAQVETAQALVSLSPVNPALFNFPMDSDPRLRSVIACGMTTSGNPDAIQLIADNLHIVAADTQCHMLTALVAKPTPAALPLIEIALDSKNTDVQLAAIAAAGTSGNETIVPKLAALLDSENKTISAAAFAALAQLPDRDGKTDKALYAPGDTLTTQRLLILAQRQNRGTFPAAIENTSAADDSLRAAAYEAAGLLVRPGDLAQILPLAANIKKPADRREWTKALYTTAAAHPDTAEAVALLRKQLASAKQADRATLIAALTMVKSPEAKAVLDTMLASSDSSTRKETIRALSSARSETAYELLVERITAASDNSERLLAQRGAIDTLDALTMPARDKVDAYRKLWKDAQTGESKDAIIAAVKRVKSSAATALLKEIDPEQKK